MANTPNITVFLPVCSEEQLPLRNELSSVLQSAGMVVVPTDEDVLKSDALKAIGQQLSIANCSIHILYP